MSKREKRLQKLRQNPTSVSFDDLKQVLEDAGFRLDHISGSHHIFRCELGGHVFRISIPFARPVKSTYVKQSLALIDEIRQVEVRNGAEEENGTDDY